MPVIAQKKDCPDYEFKTKKEAIAHIRAAGGDPNDYKFRYIYDNMSRQRYPKGYTEAHRRAAREWKRRNYQPTGNPRGRPRKESNVAK